MTTPASIKSYGEMADFIGDIRGQIRHLQDRLTHVEDIMKNEGVTIAEGDKFRVAISYDVSRATTNWKKIAERYNPSRQIISGNTKVSLHDRLTVSALPTH